MGFTLIPQIGFLLTSMSTPLTRNFTRRLGKIRCCANFNRRAIPISRLQPANVMNPEEQTQKLRLLKQKMELLGVNYDDSCTPGLYDCLFCPKCKGGQSMERTLSVHVSQDGDLAMWRCFQPSCGWAGKAFPYRNDVNKVESAVEMTEESLELEPPGRKLIEYFKQRGISEQTLRRNSVMQKSGDQVVIAFTYRQEGALVGCKYRTLGKRFWQERGTERWLYGVDDTYEASEIIIVEGETDKLSMEEAGFRNCISVPNGAPHKVSSRELPPLEKDTAFPYIWNNKECLDKVSRFILATDGDTPGQALAVELARRLGKERCWHVTWPKKDSCIYYKDSNEVLMSCGPSALREVIENAQLFQALMYVSFDAERELKEKLLLLESDFNFLYGDSIDRDRIYYWKVMDFFSFSSLDLIVKKCHVLNLLFYSSISIEEE